MTFSHTGRLSLDHRHARPSFPPTPDSDLDESSATDFFAVALEQCEAVSPTSHSSKVYLTSLTSWRRYVHPASGTLRSIHEDGAAGEAVRHLVIDMRFIIALNEYDDGSKSKVATTGTSSPLVLPNVWKLSLQGAEFAECTDGRAAALAEILAACGKEADGSAREGSGVLEVEWLHAQASSTEGSDRYAATYTTNLVHDLVIDAGTANWGRVLETPAIKDDEQEAEEWRYQRVVTPLQKGLKRLALQGGFVLPNPASCEDDGAAQSGFNPRYSLQPQFRFAFADWVGPGGLDVLSWSFQGNYTPACVASILRHLFKYAATEIISANAPYRALVLDHLPHSLVAEIASGNEKTMDRLGLTGNTWSNPAIKSWLVDTTFVMLDGHAERLWAEEPEEEEETVNERDERERQFRRLKADMVAVQEVERVRPQAPGICHITHQTKPTSITVSASRGGNVPSSAKHTKRTGGPYSACRSPISPPLSRAASSDSRGEISLSGDSFGLGGPQTASTQTSVDADYAGRKEGGAAAVA